MRVALYSSRGGYIFLVSVLAIGAIAAAASLSLMLLGWAAEQNGRTIELSARALEYAHVCAERALSELRTNSTYAGNQTISLSNGSCDILTIGGTGNEDRVVCTQGDVGTTARRFEIQVAQLLPTVTIADWREVPDFTLCSE